MGDIWEKDITRVRETSQRLGVGPGGRRASTCSPATSPSPPATHPSPELKAGLVFWPWDFTEHHSVGIMRWPERKGKEARRASEQEPALPDGGPRPLHVARTRSKRKCMCSLLLANDI